MHIFRNLPRALGSIFVGTLFSCSAYSPWTFTGNWFASPRPMGIDPSGPSYRARQASFLSSSVAPFTPFGSSLFEKGGQLGRRLKNYRMTIRCPWVDGWIWRGEQRQGWGDDGWKRRAREVYKTSDKLSRSNYGARHVSFFDWFLPRIEMSLHLPCTFPIKTTPFSSYFSTFVRNTLLEHVRHICQRSVCSIPAYFVLIRSVLGSVSNSFLFHHFIFIFILSLKTLYLAFVPCHPLQTRQS